MSEDELDFERFLKEQTAGSGKSHVLEQLNCSLLLKAVDCFLELYIEARQVNSPYIRFEQSEDDQSKAFYGSRENPTIKNFPDLPFPYLLQMLRDRTYFWPEQNDPTWESAEHSKRKILMAPLSSYRMQALIQFGPKPPRNIQWCELSDISYSLEQSVLELLDVSSSNAAQLKQAITKQTGIFLAGHSPQNAEVDAVAIMLALRPDAILISKNQLENSLDEVLECARTSPVIIACESALDPIELLRSVCSLSDRNSDIREQLVEMVHLSFVHRRLKRVCGHCARGTEISDDLRLAFQPELRSVLPNSHALGRRCAKCGFLGYHGSVGVDSLIFVGDQLHEALLNHVTTEELGKLACTSNLKPLLVDGVEKIRDSLTTYDELLNVTNRVPTYYLLASSNSVANEPVNKHATRQAPEQISLLLVEDDPAQRDILEFVLKNEGYQIITAENGKLALNLLKSEQVHIIVTDMMMPEMDGITLVKHLKSDPELRKIPVLVLTVLDNADVEFTALSAKADDFCPKRSSRKVILKRIERLVESSMAAE